MTAQVRIWVVTDDFDPRGIDGTDAAPFVPEPRQPAESEFPAEHIVLGYN
ncbi:hypothetical protein GCM10027598_55140 [Amycolatopsis oliviviridis]|uniref:Uncharacterized protein n=1 Tax=Amycolatopsis oliviviridis TaxID=1471590 RepID=A0ABQ3MA56_9PSEU|nr:hypothetical protein [Amycolatopsis oliviviridis]GHH35063.1 hypothetical protein GCM10017790_75720 [Amycolatopsis oliviviridis]